ncbi:MAG: T9SS type A sorting domain-containing protein [Bacteroidota bacterium]
MKKTVLFLMAICITAIAVSQSTITNFNYNESSRSNAFVPVTASGSVAQTALVNPPPAFCVQPTGTSSICDGSSIFFSTYTSSGLFDEHFDGTTLPAGWTAGPNALNWNLSNSSNAGISPKELCFHYNPTFTGESVMTSPIVNTTGNSKLILKFRDKVFHYANNFTIGVKTSSDGITWNTIYSNNITTSTDATQHTIEISNVDVGSPTFRIAFFFSGNSNDIDYWFIDDVTLFQSCSSITNDYSYYWPTTGDVTETIEVTYSDYFYVIVNNNDWTVYSDTVELIVTYPPDQEICMVTVDSILGLNQILWEKPVTNQIDSFRVYKENESTGIYELLESVPYNNPSIITDFGSDPSTHADRYKISTVDICGNEGNQSPEHRTIFLEVGGDVLQNTLAWNSYEGFPNTYLYIYGGTDPANMAFVDSVDMSYNGWTQPGAKAYQGGYWRVSVKKEFPCIISTHKASSGTYTTSISNMEQFRLPSLEICAVTVDSATGYNKIMWEEPYSADISEFYIYKEDMGIYQFYTSVTYGSPSYYIDYGSDPSSYADRYKMSAYYWTGEESDQSVNHRSMYLQPQDNPYIHHLHWNGYEGFPYDYSYIYTSDSPLSPMQLIDSVASNLNDWTLTTPPLGAQYYQILVRKENECYVKTSDTTSMYNSIAVSNTQLFLYTGSPEQESPGQILLMPNPARDYFTVCGFTQPIQLSVMDMTGRQVFESSCKEASLKIATESWPAGIYTLRVKGEKGVVWKKVVVEK